MHEEDLTQVMRRVELFRGLSQAQLQRIANISAREVYGKGDTICTQGSPGDRMYIISHGQVEVVVRDRSGESYPVLYLGQGQVVGEMALIDQGVRSASVIGADDNTIVYSIPNEDFTQLCQTDTAIGYVMMRNLAQDLSFKLRHRDS
ncbi:MAG: cyclic nucleotide-binding domain-containing protein [Chloroflexi bacterium]|nr:cyclic nucleotide-binding domain-containing protein [Chloroflexota bacterium]